LNYITTFGEDAAGNLYIGSAAGNIFRIVTDRVSGDIDGDGRVDADDLTAWKQYYGSVGEPGDVYGDIDGDGDVDGTGFLMWQRNLGYQPPGPTPVAPESARAPEPGGMALLVAAALAMRLIYSENLRLPPLDGEGTGGGLKCDDAGSVV
jgi:hypothetical protein